MQYITQLFHIFDLKWDPEILRSFGIPEAALPEVTMSDGDFGVTDLGGLLPKPVPICGVLGDSHGALFGQGCLKPGMIKATYGTAAKGASGTASMLVDDDYDESYLVVVATPGTYVRHYWNDDEGDDLQWPYEVSFTGTDLLGNVTIEAGDPTSTSIDLEVACDASANVYELGSVNLLKNGVMAKMANAFKLQPAEIAAACNAPAAGTTGAPSEGKIVIGMSSTTGNVSYGYTANLGFWCDGSGNVVSWGNGQTVFVEFNPSSYLISYGHMHGVTKAGTTYTLHPTYVYTKNGVQYKAIINLKLKF